MSSDSIQVSSSAPKTFEFTKRKRWADLLVSELTDGINLVLSGACTILYCAPAITEITGWKDSDLIDCDFSELLTTTDDRNTFQASFDESIQSDSELHAYLRIKCSDNMPYVSCSKGVLFEIKGRPRSMKTDGVFFFMTAKPYPSRNTEMLNTYLDLKMESDRLQRGRLELSQRLPQEAAAQLSAVAGQVYATSPIQSTDISGAFYPTPRSGSGMNVIVTSQSPLAEDESEDASRRKKLKKALAGEQYVCITCGRTDSPEWRKGPLGPKTLCNACGLRWAKQTRSGKVEEPVAGSGNICHFAT